VTWFLIIGGAGLLLVLISLVVGDVVDGLLDLDFLDGDLFSLTSIAAFLGASMQGTPSGWTGAVICLLAIFAPSFLLVSGFLPFWERLRGNQSMRAALAGVNAAVVGLLLAALYDPVWTHAIFSLADFAVALLALMALAVWKWPAWLVVAGGSAAGRALALF